MRFLNNLFFNPAPYQSQWQQINVFGSSPSNSRNMPRVVRADDDVAFQGNVWWNGGRCLQCRTLFRTGLMTTLCSKAMCGGMEVRVIGRQHGILIRGRQCVVGRRYA